MNEIAEAFVSACRDEIEAPKPGNVHIFADGHGMTVDDFLQSAEAAAPTLCAPGTPVGRRIFAAVEGTDAAVAKNTNLGIILLCAPLAAAAEMGGDIRENLRAVLAGLTRDDASLAFKAILRAGPAGLGTASRHDVREGASVTLLESMREAAPRDKVAYQYAFDFSDVYDAGMESLRDAEDKCWQAPWPAASAYLAFLARFPDSHIARKFGPEASLRVQTEAIEVHKRFMNAANPQERLQDLLHFDRRLKNLGLNPGTSADLTVASLFAEKLTRVLINRSNNG
ncbi:MAG TPA: triphosphoribosyl-dephospho-CoA synthase [Methylocella sp.]|nr:triphosphoribosyl-dephospho-CoA synthase [Methylocella sp.]